jgi:hypothetical protein
MHDCVFDASFVAKANGLLVGERPGNLLHRRLTAMRSVASGQSRVRYNRKLFQEYAEHVREHRNDVVEQFFELLDSAQAVRVGRNTLRSHEIAKANDCRWPAHDRHVLAAAIGGTDVVIHVTENPIGGCAASVHRIFGFHVNHIA